MGFSLNDRLARIFGPAYNNPKINETTDNEDDDTDGEDSLGFEETSETITEKAPEASDAAYLAEKQAVAKDDLAALVEGRIIFVKKDKKLFMIAQLDDDFPPEHIKEAFDDAADGGKMWVADVIFRIKGRGYSNPEKTIRSVNPEIFKKQNWKNRTE